MDRLLDIVVWTVILTMFLIWFALAAGCSTLEGSYSTVPHDAAWRAQQDREDQVMQFLGHVAEGSFHE